MSLKLEKPGDLIDSVRRVFDEYPLLKKSIQEKDDKIKELIKQLELYKSKDYKKEVTLFVSKNNNHFTWSGGYIRDSDSKLNPILHEASFSPVIFENQEEICIIRSDGINIKICSLIEDQISKLFMINYDREYNIDHSMINNIVANKNIILARVKDGSWWTLKYSYGNEEFVPLRGSSELLIDADYYLASNRSKNCDQNILIQIMNCNDGKDEVIFHYLVDVSRTFNFELRNRVSILKGEIKEIIPFDHGVAYIELINSNFNCFYRDSVSEAKLIAEGAKKISLAGTKLEVTLNDNKVIYYDPQEE